MKKQFTILLLVASGLIALGFGFGGNVGNLFSFQTSTLPSDPFASGSKIVIGSFDDFGNFSAVPFEMGDFSGLLWGKVSADISNPDGQLNIRNAGGGVNIQAAPGSPVTIFSGGGYEMPGGGDTGAGSIDIVTGGGWWAGDINIRTGWSATRPAFIKLSEDSGNYLTIINTGVGINKTNPECALDVAGTIKATAFIGGSFPGFSTNIIINNLNFSFTGGLLVSVVTNGTSPGGSDFVTISGAGFSAANDTYTRDDATAIANGYLYGWFSSGGDYFGSGGTKIGILLGSGVCWVASLDAGYYRSDTPNTDPVAINDWYSWADTPTPTPTITR